MNAKPYQSQVDSPNQVGVPVESTSEPWRALQPGETLRQWHARMSHTCYRCGLYDEDNERLDRHESIHDARGVKRG